MQWVNFIQRRELSLSVPSNFGLSKPGVSWCIMFCCLGKCCPKQSMWYLPTWKVYKSKPFMWGNRPGNHGSLCGWKFGWSSIGFVGGCSQVEEVFNELDAWAGWKFMVGSPFKFPIHLGQWRDWPMFFFWWGSVQDQDKDYRFYYLSTSRGFYTLETCSFLGNGRV